VKPWATISAAATRERGALLAALSAPGRQQPRLLQYILSANRDTRFGEQHGFGKITRVEDYRRAVPIRRDVEFVPWIERVAAGEPRVLTSDAPLAFEATGGTVRGAKLIPYTAASLAAFRAGVLPWLAHLLEQRPRIADGVAYVAASPVARRKAAFACKLPVGLASDAAYLGAELAPTLAQVITRPPPFADLARWRVGTLAHLAAHRDLTLISIWSPTFLLELLEALPGDAAHVRVALYEAGDPNAALRVERALTEPGGLVRHLWPKLQAVSMWMDGPSAPYAARVGELLPGVYLDGKGVLATESVLTVRQSHGCVPALTSAFIEFLDAEGNSFLAHEIVAGRRYRTVITTPGGLYRYDLGDVLDCESQGVAGPTLRFIGRAGVVSDLVGEKLSDSFVANVLAHVPLGAALVPSAQPWPHYELWVDAEDSPDELLGSHVDELLHDNPQYAYARQIGQLHELDVIFAPGFAQHRARQLALRGVRLGDAKSCALILDRSQLPSHISRVRH
jgi:hypothetical protein